MCGGRGLKELAWFGVRGLQEGEVQARLPGKVGGVSESQAEKRQNGGKEGPQEVESGLTRAPNEGLPIAVLRMP